MKVVVVTGIAASLSAGAVLALTSDQIRRRAHAVVVLKGDALKALADELKGVPEGLEIVELTTQVQFKRGETIAIVRSAELSKTLFADIAPAGSEAAAEAKAEVGKRKSHGARVSREREAKRQAEDNTRQTRKRAGKPPAAVRPAGLASGETARDAKSGKGAGERHLV